MKDARRSVGTRAHARALLACICSFCLIASAGCLMAATGEAANGSPAQGSVGESGPTGGRDSGPTVAWLTPLADHEFSGLILLWVVASGPDPIARVDFTVDGVPVGTKATDPYMIQLDTVAFQDGTHVFGARAVDVWGREAFDGIPVPIWNICPGGPPCLHPIPIQLPTGLSADKSRVCVGGSEQGNRCRPEDPTPCQGDLAACKTAAELITDQDVRDAVKQVFIRVDWDRLEPRDDDFQFGELETRIQEVAAVAGWKASIAVVPGTNTPDWLFDAPFNVPYTEGFGDRKWCSNDKDKECDCPDSFCGSDNKCADGSWKGFTCDVNNDCQGGGECKGARMPVVSNMWFILEWDEFIRMLGQTYNSDARIGTVRITGINHDGAEYGRLTLGGDGEPHEHNLYTLGLKPSSIQGVNQGVFSAFKKGFPNKYLVLSLAEPFDWVRKQMDPDQEGEPDPDPDHAWSDPPWLPYCIKGGWGNRLIWTTLEQAKRSLRTHLVVQNNGLMGCNVCEELGPLCEDDTECGCPHDSTPEPPDPFNPDLPYRPGKCQVDPDTRCGTPLETTCFGGFRNGRLCLCAAGDCHNDTRRYCLDDGRPRKRKIMNGMRWLGRPAWGGGDGIKTAWQMGWWATNQATESFPELPCDLNRMGSGNAYSNLWFACDEGTQSNPSYFEIYTLDLKEPSVKDAVLHCRNATPPSGEPTTCDVPGPDCHKEGILPGQCCPRCLDWDCDDTCDPDYWCS